MDSLEILGTCFFKCTMLLLSNSRDIKAINILTGSLDELAPWAASHMDIDGFDISGIAKKKHGALKEAGAENLKRIHSFGSGKTPARILAFMESKTVWHSVGV